MPQTKSKKSPSQNSGNKSDQSDITQMSAQDVLAQARADLQKAQDALAEINRKTQEIYLQYKQATIKKDIAVLEAVKKIYSEESESST